MKYGQFCPLAKTTEILGEKWTILIIREILMGGRRFSELQRGLGLISPALLTARLKSLEDQGMVVKRRAAGQRSFEYYPTEACEALLPALISLGEWGLCWAQHTIVDDDYDVEFLMYYLERSINPEKLIGDETVIQFEFTDLSYQSKWWLLVKGDRVDLCIKDPAKDIDIFFTTTVRTMTAVWMGDRTYKNAITEGDLSVQGPPALTRNISAWLTPSIYANSPRSPSPGNMEASS